MNALQKVLRSGLCAGCGLCESLLGPDRVAMHMDHRGYLRPLIHKNPSKMESDLLHEVCPGLNVLHFDKSSKHDVIWGPIRKLYTATAADKVIRHMGSSGGVLSAIQIFLLETRKVEYIVSTSAAKEDPLGTEINICRTREDVIRGAGSRYAPSAPLKSIIEQLNAPGRFAFVGKPCDVAALRRLSQFNKQVALKIPYMLSFMCAGVPSRTGSNSIIEKLGTCIDDVATFRYRGDGWPGFTKAILKDGTMLSMEYASSWGDILSKYVQWRCKLCPDGTGEFADLACGDAWHVSEDGSPDFSEHEGQSYLISRTSRGSELVEQCILSNTLEIIREEEVEKLETVQFHQAYRRKTMLARYLALRVIGSVYPKFDIRILLNASLRVKLWPLIRVFLGALKRGVRMRMDIK